MRIMKVILVLLIIPFLIIPAFAQTNSQTLQTEKGTLEVKLTYEEIVPNTQTKINIDFINPQTQKIQEHVDWSVSVLKDDKTIFGPIPLTHTSVGSVKIPIEFDQGEGVYTMDFKIEGILFQPIPPETVSFDISVGDVYAQPTTENNKADGEKGGCLIATATYGSEMAPQVQQLRELRDNTILKTKSGMAFMTSFNQFYYSFSPTVADFEREHPIFKEVTKMALTPMLSSLSLLNQINIDSEEEMLGYGIPIVLLNIGMYIGIPIFGILKMCQSRKTSIS